MACGVALCRGSGNRRGAAGAGASGGRRVAVGEGVLVQSATGNQRSPGRKLLLQERQFSRGRTTVSRGDQVEPRTGRSLAAPGRDGRKAEGPQERPRGVPKVSRACAGRQERRRHPQTHLQDEALIVALSRAGIRVRRTGRASGALRAAAPGGLWPAPPGGGALPGSNSGTGQCIAIRARCAPGLCNRPGAAG
jgi:hypothetical protein